jgi:hypothetical protein
MTNHIDGVKARLEFDEGQLHTTFHGRNDNMFCAFVEASSDSEAAAEICHKVNIHSELLAALKEVVRISDRKHDAWDSAHAAIAKAEGS